MMNKIGDSLPGQHGRRILLNALHLRHDYPSFLSFAIDVEHLGSEATCRDSRIENMIEID